MSGWRPYVKALSLGLKWGTPAKLLLAVRGAEPADQRREIERLHRDGKIDHERRHELLVALEEIATLYARGINTRAIETSESNGWAPLVGGGNMKKTFR